MFTKKLFVYFSILFSYNTLTAEAKKPLLIYNQFPRVWKMDFEAMRKHLNNIAAMGFNVVWVNPFFKTSDGIVTRIDGYTGGKLSVKGSLYAMKNPSAYEYNIVDEQIKAYTKKAQDLEITPIFDLVVNHIAKDSYLYTNNIDKFKKEQPMGLDDVIPFDRKLRDR